MDVGAVHQAVSREDFDSAAVQGGAAYIFDFECCVHLRLSVGVLVV